MPCKIQTSEREINPALCWMFPQLNPKIQFKAIYNVFKFVLNNASANRALRLKN